MGKFEIVLLASLFLPVLLGLFGVGGSSGGVNLKGFQEDLGHVVGGDAFNKAFGGSKGISMPQMSEKQKAALNALAEQGGQLSATGKNLLSDFNQGKLTEGQQAELDLKTSAEKAQQQQFFAKAGLSDSSIATGASAQLQQQTLALKQQMLEGNFREALGAFGLATSDYNSLISSGQFQQNLKSLINSQKAAADQGAIGQAFGSIGKVFGKSGGGGGGPGQATTGAAAPGTATAGGGYSGYGGYGNEGAGGGGGYTPGGGEGAEMLA